MPRFGKRHFAVQRLNRHDVGLLFRRVHFVACRTRLLTFEMDRVLLCQQAIVARATIRPA